MELYSQILSAVLFIPFAGWGIYTLRLRYSLQVDIKPSIEVFTAIGLVLFYTFELTLLKSAAPPMSSYFILAVLGLFASGAALYGPMMVSLASQALVDQMLPHERSATHEPNYAAAEAFERAGDYEEAIREYKAVARQFPRDAVPMVRIADNLVKRDELSLAAPWFESGLECLDSPDKNLSVTNRLAEIYARQLGRREDAVRVLRNFLERFPDSPYADSVRRRVESLEHEDGDPAGSPGGFPASA